MQETGLSPKPVLPPAPTQAHWNSADLWKTLAGYFLNACAIEDNLQASWNQNVEGQQYCRTHLQIIPTHTVNTCWMPALSVFNYSLDLFKKFFFSFISTDNLKLNNPTHITIALDQGNWKQQALT